jgi:hypothetical protein
MSDGPALVVGVSSEPHAAAVGSSVEARNREVVFLDAVSLSETRWRWASDVLEIFHGDTWVRPERGWYRRLAPAGHYTGTRVGSRVAVEIGARLALLTALAEAPIWWLTDYWSIVRGENKLTQYRHARRGGIPVPETVVVSNRADIPPSLGELFVVKPLGVGDFVESDTAFAVHARLVDRNDEILSGIGEAPFLVQAHIVAREHLRLVTVRDRCWAARLDAAGLPLDWRESESAHSDWVGTYSGVVEDMALSLAKSLQLGYSSQDWIVDEDGQPWFVDANPAGQWLFLPSAQSTEITDALAHALAGEDR